MGYQEIEQGFVSAGWELDGSFSEYLIICYAQHLSIIAYPQVWETGLLEFQICDHENELSYWVKEIVTPERAALLLEEHEEPLLIEG